MNIKSKIRGALLILLVLTALVAVTVWAADKTDYTGTLTEANSLLAEAESKNSLEAKAEALDKLMKYLEEKPVNPEDEGYSLFTDKMYKENLACAKLYLAELDVSLGTAKNGIAVRKLSAFVKSHEIPDTLDGYSSFKTEMDGKIAAHNEAMAKNKAALEDKAELSEYQYVPYFDADFNTAGDIGGLEAQKNYDGSKLLSFIGQQSGKDGDNGYYTVTYDIPGYHFRTNAALTAVSGSLVFECDFTTFGKLPNNGVSFDNGSYTAIDGTTLTPKYFTVTADGNIYDPISKTTLLEGAIVQGEWTHISMLIDIDTCVAKLYIDYELVGSIATANNKKGLTYTPKNIRIGGSPSEGGAEFSLDNVLIYRGSTLRDADKLNKMKDDERFIYYGDVLTNASSMPESRITAYEGIGKMLGKYYNTSTEKHLSNDKKIQSVVTNYLSFDYSVLEKALADKNLKKYTELCDALFKIERTPDTLGTRTNYISLIDVFITACKGQITANDEYFEYTSLMNTERQHVTNEESINSFINIIRSFENASKIADMQTYYAEAQLLEEKLELELLEDENYSSFKYAYEKYINAESTIADSISIDNSRQIMLSVEKLLKYQKEQWDEKYSEMNPYVVKVRALLKSENYDKYYEGLDEYLGAFVPINEYFYEKLQLIHIEHCNTELKKCDESEQYYERYGICIALKRYLEKEDIDFERDEFKKILIDLDEKLSVLDGEREEYFALMNQNTERFIETCAGLVGNIGYTETRRIVDEASRYYDVMNVDSAEAKTSLILYNLRSEELRIAEEYANEFIMRVGLLSVAGEELFSKLVECGKMLPRLEREVEGVEKAIETYNKACAEYNESVAVTNSDILAISDAVCTFANKDGFESFINTVLSEISK